jgi:hypothetical protein
MVQIGANIEFTDPVAAIVAVGQTLLRPEWRIS